MSSTSRLHLDGDVMSASVRATFANYERIPITRASAELLRIKPERRPRIVERTIGDGSVLSGGLTLLVHREAAG